MKKLFFLLLITFSLSFVTSAQHYDTLIHRDSGRDLKAQVYKIGDTSYVYPRPRPFAFATLIPKTFVGATKLSFRKESIKPWAVVVASTLVLVLADQEIADGVQSASRRMGIDNERISKTLISFKIGKQDFDVYDAPGNLNSAIYSLGEGIPSLVLSAGLWGYGLAKKDYRAISTASQIVQATTACGFMTQFLKRVSGRESPFRATAPGGVWRPLPKLSVYRNDVSSHDAFPSGHMGTMVSTYVVITENYPEKKWIRPVGITIMSLVGLSMINNGVHWSSDYPLAVGMGYAFGKATVKLNRFIRGEPVSTKKRKF